MAKDKFTALWVSHSSISDYLKCPRAYYYKNVYKDPGSGRKITLMSPNLALGQSVHEVLEVLSHLKTSERFQQPLYQRLNEAWKKVSGLRGGFLDSESEHYFKKRAEQMLERVYQHPGPIAELSVKIKSEKDLAKYWLSEEDNIILCGKLDWLEFLPQTNSVHIIDFKSGQKRNQEHSWQLPIYYLLASHCQKRPVSRISYWFLESDREPQEQPLPDMAAVEREISSIARKIKLARQLKKFDCPSGTCRACQPFDLITHGEGEWVGNDLYGADVYILPSREFEIDEDNSVVL